MQARPYASFSAVLVLLLGLAPVSGDLPVLAVSGNQRFLVQSDGSAFFYLADTAWELFHRLTREEADEYLRDRAAKHFTVIQAVALAEFDGLSVPNAYGHLPLVDMDPSRPNEAYFQHVDWIVNRANQLGLYVGLLPTWGDKWNRKWGAGPEVFTPGNAATYGAWLGRRYRDSGVIWILGGDRPVESDEHTAIIRAMAEAIRAADGGQHLMTLHTCGGQSSSEWFHDDGWLDFNMRQNGHETRFAPRYAGTRADYNREPPKPVIDGEPVYEDHPISFKAEEHGHSLAADVRRPLYWDLFTGACGHTYGHHSVWQFYDERRRPVNNPLFTWREALQRPGAGQMQHARALLESRPFLTRVPDSSIIVPGEVPTAVPGAGLAHMAATRDAERTYVMVYCPAGRAFRVDLGIISARTVRAWWFDPRTGEATLIGELDNIGQREFVPPDVGEYRDWVLVLDDTSRDYPPPGSR